MNKQHHSSFPPAPRLRWAGIIHRSCNKGQSLIEVLIALAVGSILIIGGASVIVPSLRANTQANKVQVASALGKELLENIRVVSEGNWHNSSDLATTSANKYFLISASSPFIAATGTEGISADGISSGLVGYWKFDETTGTVAYDFSGNGNKGALTNGPASTAGNIGGALSFDGINDYVDVPYNSVLEFGSQDFAYSLWLNYSSVAGDRSLLDYRTGGKIFSFYWNATRGYELRVNDGSGWVIDSLPSAPWHDSPSTGAWYHVALVRSGNAFTVYKNGVSLGSFSSSATVPSFPTNRRIGYAADNSMPFAGSIDDVRIYNRALSLAEIQGIYKGNIYTRYFYFDNVSRDASGNISGSGANDPSTKKATVVYGWPGGPTSSFSTYLTRFRNNVFEQTDWSGGPGQNGPVTSANNKFSTSTQIDYSTTNGSIMIKLQ